MDSRRRKREARVIRRISIVLMLAALVGASAGCVDGTTPDCSDAASGCGPDYDAYPSDSSPSDGPPAEAAPEGGREGGSDAPAG
jgi:hypothetical protein